MSLNVFIVRAHTNMHVGSGDTYCGAVDKLVQRDAVSSFPVIHASSLKGAIREFFEANYNLLGAKEKTDSKYLEPMLKIFGGSRKELLKGFDQGDETKGDNKKEEDAKTTGLFKFFDASLLCYPVHMDGEIYSLVTCKGIIENLKHLVAVFDKNNRFKDIVAYNDELCQFETKYINGWRIIPVGKIEKQGIFEKDILVLEDSVFSNIVSNLPVIARNYLENGISENLWYEEFVPRESCFLALIDNNSKDEEIGRKFRDFLNQNVIQIGANASVGYGYCSFREVGGK
ncbi:MAG: type III-B CRISPR module RAMP protein Cmr4 [Bacillota bacterium]